MYVIEFLLTDKYDFFMLNTKLFLPLYSWGMGTALIIIFALVCVALVLIVLHLMRTDTPKEEVQDKLEEENYNTTNEE